MWKTESGVSAATTEGPRSPIREPSSPITALDTAHRIGRRAGWDGSKGNARMACTLPDDRTYFTGATYGSRLVGTIAPGSSRTPACRQEREKEGRAFTGLRFRPDTALVSFDNAGNRGQADPGSFEVGLIVKALEHAEPSVGVEIRV